MEGQNVLRLKEIVLVFEALSSPQRQQRLSGQTNKLLSISLTLWNLFIEHTSMSVLVTTQITTTAPQITLNTQEQDGWRDVQ